MVGVGGVQRQRTGAWNLFYRFAPAAWGRGLATELGRAALDAAVRLDPHVAVIAWIDPGNTAPARVAERLGLLQQGKAPAPSDGVRRLAFTDRPVDLGR
jgi:RimJ/RimL family protein N-acetyltransferase